MGCSAYCPVSLALLRPSLLQSHQDSYYFEVCTLLLVTTIVTFLLLNSAILIILNITHTLSCRTPFALESQRLLVRVRVRVRVRLRVSYYSEVYSHHHCYHPLLGHNCN